MKKRNNKAITLIEVVIVSALSCVIMGVGMAMMSRSNVQFKKSNDLVSIQRLMDNIVERMRSDVRALKKVENNCDKNIFEFKILKNGEEATIKYQFEPDKKTLYRYEITNNGELKTDFHGSNQILSLNFDWHFKDEEDENSEDGSSKNNEDRKFSCLNVAMQIASNEYSGKKKDTTTLSIACQFYSTCVESDLSIKW